MSLQSNLERAANGLVMMSESEYPFDYISSEETALSPALALKLTGKPEGTLITTTTLDYLLRNLTDPSSGSVSSAEAEQYQQMAAALKDSLKELTVYRVGDVQVDVLILGLTAGGKVAGMRTKLIET
ncbi:nuclease A inhibitor family protein [Mucilaginibacter arboris]|uniref:Nuclease A inhibitor-like protein n=1 Tax=Mucilaginibacter arboris TaxID=2682090 RepID=A0A7K1T086_9SPHI|nr:nuclease A inhibitor family protein [Mucilaginibacter arboris]MVN22969.1 hypothetical protein [Mucilaginibacter arboris]